MPTFFSFAFLAFVCGEFAALRRRGLCLALRLGLAAIPRFYCASSFAPVSVLPSWWWGGEAIWYLKHWRFILYLSPMQERETARIPVLIRIWAALGVLLFVVFVIRGNKNNVGFSP